MLCVQSGSQVQRLQTPRAIEGAACPNENLAPTHADYIAFSVTVLCLNSCLAALLLILNLPATSNISLWYPSITQDSRPAIMLLA